MIIKTSRWAVPLVLSSLYLAGCSSSSSSPATDPDDDDPGTPPVVNQPVTDQTPVTDPGGQTPGTGGDPTVPGSGTPTTESPIPPGSGDPVVTGSASLLGTLSLSYESTDNETNASAIFFSLGREFPAAQLQDGFESEVLPTDTCEVVQSAIPDTDIGEFDLESVLPALENIPATVSAGEVITLTSPAGTLASLVEGGFAGFSVYGTPDDIDIAGPVPVGVTADIPGAANGFPAFAAVPILPTTPLDMTISSNGDGGVTLAWNGTNNDKSAVTVMFSAFDQGAADFSSLTHIQCALKDDGEQVVPASLLPTGNVLISGGVASRTSIAIQQQGNAVLIISSSSSASFPAITL